MNSNPFWHQPESRRLEFKEVWPSGDGVARTAIAFANGTGGKIVFGAREEPREIIGISHDEAVNYEVQADEIDLSRFIQDYKDATGKTFEGEQLKNLGLFVAERGSRYLTNAAILLSESPKRSRIFPYAKIECARFKGTTTKVFLDQASGPWGTGIQKMRAETIAYPSIELRIHEVDYAFQVQFVNTEAQEAHETMEDTMHVTMEDTMEARLLKVLKGEMTRAQLQEVMQLKNADHFRKAYLLPAIEKGLIERTIPEKPRSKNQRYRLTKKGKTLLKRTGSNG